MRVALGAARWDVMRLVVGQGMKLAGIGIVLGMIAAVFITPAVQSKLLRVLEDKAVRPLGDTHSETVNVRVIAATNRDLRHAVRAGQFRDEGFRVVLICRVCEVLQRYRPGPRPWPGIPATKPVPAPAR